MPRFDPEPPHQHGTAPGTAIVLVNLGTPEAPTAPALKRYLRQFLSDPRVVEIPRPVWWLILNGIILNTRPKKSAEKYAAVWTPEGSPLKVHTERQAKFLAGYLGERGHHVTVVWAMRYGAPALSGVLDRLLAAGVNRILLLPMYPQYSATTTATVIDEACNWLLRRRNQPEMRLVRNFHNNGDGTFEDVTEAAGLLSFHPTQTAAWFDFDGDGQIDRREAYATFDTDGKEGWEVVAQFRRG